MKWFGSRKIDLDIVRYFFKIRIAHIRLYLDSLDPATKIFRVMVILTCIYSVFLLTRIKNSQRILVYNAKMVNEWRATITPQPSKESTESAKKAIVYSTPSATITYKALLPSSTPAPSATRSATLAPDNTPPRIVGLSGPYEGSTIHYNSFCFPVRIADDRSAYPNVTIQYRFDYADWTAWNNNLSPCFSGVGDGQHTFVVQARDQAGNISSPVTRTFVVMVGQ